MVQASASRPFLKHGWTPGKNMRQFRSFIFPNPTSSFPQTLICWQYGTKLCLKPFAVSLVPAQRSFDPFCNVASAWPCKDCIKATPSWMLPISSRTTGLAVWLKGEIKPCGNHLLSQTLEQVLTNIPLQEKVTDDCKKVPYQIHDSTLVQLFYKQETLFGSPKAVIYLSFICPVALSSPENAVLTQLYIKLLIDHLNELSYDAELAGLSYHIHATTTGFLASFSG